MSASAGIVLIIPKGEYDGTVTYNMLNLVTYQNGSYLAKQTTTGNLPTDTTYWQKMVSVDDMTGASAGAAGVHGLVPAPSAGDQAKFLQGDGTWAAVDLSSKADQSIIGGSYNASTAYEPGDRFSYNGVRYKVIIESGTVSGQTPPNANYYEVCSVDDDISQLNNSLMGEILWTNPSPTSDFAAQTITLPTNTYNFYAIEIKGHKVHSVSTIIFKMPRDSGDYDINQINIEPANDRDWIHDRRMFTSNNQLTFRDCILQVLQGGSSTYTTRNDLLIPYKVYGTNIL